MLDIMYTCFMNSCPLSAYLCFGSVHIRDKLTVGERLAFAGLNVAYGTHDYSTGPYPAYLELNQSTKSIVVQYDSLHTQIQVRSLSGFEVNCYKH